MKYKFLLFLVFFIANFSIAQQFTIAVIPDTQNYVNKDTQKSLLYPLDSAQIFYNQMQYIADNSEKNGGSIVFAVHVGDHVSHWGNEIQEWERAKKGMLILNDCVPFIAVPGNHDYDKAYDYGNGKHNRIEGGSLYNEYFGPDSIFFKNKDWYKGSYNNGMNSYAIYKNHKIELLFIGLELEPSDQALEWAQKVIDENRDVPTIVVTHEYLAVHYDTFSPGNAAFTNQNYRKLEGSNRNTTEQVYNNFISKNNQIFLVLCGHAFSGENGEGARTDVNDFGNKVYSLLQDYQGRKSLFDMKELKGRKLNCGDGWLRLLHFDINKGMIKISTYNTETKTYEKDMDSDFTIKFDWNWKERFNTPVQLD